VQVKNTPKKMTSHFWSALHDISPAKTQFYKTQNRPQDIFRAKTLFFDHFLKCQGHLHPTRKTRFFALKGNMS
jgi:hypothetical protein